MMIPISAVFSDTEIGLIDAVQTLTDIFLRLGIAPEVLAQPFEFQQSEHLKKGRTNAAVVLGLPVSFVRDPKRQQQQQALELLTRQPPAGSA